MDLDDSSKRAEYVADAVHGVLELACDFSWRALRPCMRFPLGLFLLVLRPPNVPCSRRQQVAEKLLAADVELLDDTTLKIKWLFNQELHEAAQWRTMHSYGTGFHDYLDALCDEWPAENQLIEGWASVFKRINKTCFNTNEHQEIIKLDSR